MRQPNPDLQAETGRSAWDTALASPAVQDAITVRCELVTPMYGGGVTAGEVDCALPIRPTALRGQLRFWWRLLRCTATDGRTFREESRKLFRAETELWGGICGRGPRASQVAVRIEADVSNRQRLVSWRDAREKVRPEFPAYALILEGRDNPALLPAGTRFDLTLRFQPNIGDERRHQVIEALRWWASFGGLGARTRRGLGAVRVAGDDPALKPVAVEEVAARGGWLSVGQPARNAAAAWKSAVDRLQQFRQGPGEGRNPGQGARSGRSRWPEADAIRRLTGKAARDHAPEHPVDNAYPRAAFGLPIVFHFKDRGDPPHHTLVPRASGNGKERDRMASPLILRPWFDGRRWRPAALLLPGWRERVSVRVGFDSEGEADSTGRPAWPEDEDERRRLAAKVQPMRDRGEDALTAFMRFFEEPADSEPRSPERPRRGR